MKLRVESSGFRMDGMRFAVRGLGFQGLGIGLRADSQLYFNVLRSKPDSKRIRMQKTPGTYSAKS